MTESNNKKSKNYRNPGMSDSNRITHSDKDNTKTTSKNDFRSAYDIYNKTASKSSYNQASTREENASLDNQKEKLAIESENSDSQIGLSHRLQVNPELGTIKLNSNCQKIILGFFDTANASEVRENLHMSKSTFYDNLKKLLDCELMIKNQDTSPARYYIHPMLKLRSPSLFSLFQARVRVSEFARKNAGNSEPSSQNAFSESETLGPESENAASSPSSSSVVQDPTRQIPSNSQTTNGDPTTSENHTTNDPLKLQHDAENRDLIIRSHKFLYRIPIQRKPLNLSKKLAKETWLELKRMSNWDYYIGRQLVDHYFIEAIIQFNPRVILIRLPFIFGKDPEENLMQANEIVLNIRKWLIDRYPGLYLAPHEFKNMAPNDGTHQAIVHHQLALKARQNNITLRGRNWEIDNSKDMPELEAINKTEATTHCVKELEDFDWRADNNIYVKDLAKNQNSLSKSIQKSNKTVKEAAEVIDGMTRNHMQLTTGTMTLFDINQKSTIRVFQLSEDLEKEKQEKRQLLDQFNEFTELFKKEVSELRKEITEAKQENNTNYENAKFFYTQNQELKQQLSEALTELETSQQVPNHHLQQLQHVQDPMVDVQQAIVDNETKLENLGVRTAHQRKVILFVFNNPNLTRTQIARRLRVSGGTINNYVADKLQQFFREEKLEGERAGRIFLRDRFVNLLNER